MKQKMNQYVLPVMKISLAIMVILYWCLLFKLIDRILEQPKLKKFLRIPMGIFNTMIMFDFYAKIGNPIILYLTMTFLMLFEFYLFYHDEFLKILFCISACMLHVLPIHVIAVNVCSMVTGYSTYEVYKQTILFLGSEIAAFIMLDFAIVGVLQFIPMEHIRIINRYKEQQWFMVAWMTVNNVNNFISAGELNQTKSFPHLLLNQITAPISALIGLYIVLFFAIKTSVLLGYKEKSSALEQAVYQEQQYRNSVAKDALVYYEINLTKNRIVSEFENSVGGFNRKEDCYSDVIEQAVEKLIFPEDVDTFLEYTSCTNLIKLFERGKTELSIEYRRQVDKGIYIWVKAIMNLVRDKDTNDLIGYICIKNIDLKKRQQLEFQYKAERDSLTGLYNKEMTAKLINEQLQLKQKNENAALFMIDVDCFKEINDHFGHVFGDRVLCELGGKLKSLFGCEDIVGRIGGDEFIAFMKIGADNKRVKEKGEDICKAFRINYKGEKEEDYFISASVGIATSLKEKDDFETLYYHADIALYETKSKGKNNYTLYGGGNFRGYGSGRTKIDINVKHHFDHISSKNLSLFQEVMNRLEHYIYVINMETFEVLFMNEKVKKVMEEVRNEKICYTFFRGKEHQCEDCPVRGVTKDVSQKCTREFYNDKLHLWLESTASPLYWIDGMIACLISCTDITKQKEEQIRHLHQVEKLVYVDELTGSPTYQKFKENAQEILKKRKEKQHLIVKLDIDNFKLINEIYSYEKGDAVLCCIAGALKKTMRSENEIYARVVNDEFIALFEIQDKGEIKEIQETFLYNFYELMGEKISFKCNFPQGRYMVAPGDEKKEEITELFEKVNIAHKAAKKDKSLEYVFYKEDLTKEAIRKKEVENKMERALVDNEFIVFLQPKYHLKDETIGGAEALARWNNENMDLFNPSSFISIFEKNGFITNLDFYMLKKVCGIIKKWIADGMNPIVVSVNFSRLHLNNENFINKLCEIVDESGIERKYIEIEITETVIYDHMDTLENLLMNLHKSGFTMSIDDFGSGYSSLGMLKNLPADVIKLDRSFFLDQKDTTRSKIVVGSIIEMATALGIHIVAEGVEEKEHIDFLKNLNCDMAQGYYFAKPMKVEDFTKLVSVQQNLRLIPKEKEV